MTVKEFIENLKKVQNQDAEVITIDTDGNILKCDGFGINKVVEVNCNEDEDISNIYLVTD